MSFNFGAQPFKHDPESGYIAVCEASKENLKQNDVGSGGMPSQSKSVKNAPQAIILEVIFSFNSDGKMFVLYHRPVILK
jgi:ATP-dependent RNA helicase DDX1